jgi:sugar/nucleoside kinase (ribokinase family)
MGGGPRITALVVGAVTRDLEIGDGPERSRPGGVVHHAGLALARLGAITRVVTRVRPEDARELLQPLRAQGAEVLALPSAQTTTYRNDYSGQRDGHELLATSDSIGPADLPAAWRDPDLVQLGPLHRRDLAPDLTQALGGFKGIDLQGLVRERTQSGTRLAPFPDLGRFVAGVDVVQASESELDAALAGETLEGFVRRHGVREMIVTRGARGASLLVGGERLQIAAPLAQRRYPVGAGDVFLASYLFLRCIGRDPAAAATGASEICSEKLESGEVPKDYRPRTRA